MASIRFDSAKTPIPDWIEPPSWQSIPIVECGDRFTPIETNAALNVIALPAYAEVGMPGALRSQFLRRGVAERLLRAADDLKRSGVTLAVFDAYRPLSVQQHLFDSYRVDVRAEYSDLSEDEIVAIVRRFVALPSSDPLCAPPHLTGGAVDVYLVHAATGEPIPMGTEPDSAEEASRTRYFEDFPSEPFRSNRRFLFHAMTGAGFTNYFQEWWHYDYGNQRWANVAGKATAFYGRAADSEIEPSSNPPIAAQQLPDPLAESASSRMRCS